MSDVLEFPLTEVADILDYDVTKAGLLCARPGGNGVPARACADGGQEAEVVARFAAPSNAATSPPSPRC